MHARATQAFRSQAQGPCRRFAPIVRCAAAAMAERRCGISLDPWTVMRSGAPPPHPAGNEARICIPPSVAPLGSGQVSAAAVKLGRARTPRRHSGGGSRDRPASSFDPLLVLS